jgi:molybdate transport system ATP-binding protein
MIRIKVKKALRDFVLDVDIAAGDGEIVILMGSNGSGKTTVLNLAAGLMRPDKGVIEVGSRKLFDSDAGVDVPVEQRSVSYVFQHYALFPHLTVYDNVAFGLRMKRQPGAVIEARAREELEALGLWELRNARAAKLSGGQQQKVALARSLVVRPALLLLDEPFSALDATAGVAVRASLKARLRKDHLTAVMATHSQRDALELGDRVFLISRGKVIISGAPTNVLENRTLF